MIAGEAEPRNAPARDIAKTDGAAGGDNPCQGCAAGVSGSEHAANAGACDVRDGDVILFEDLQHSEMCEATRESAPERESNSWARGHLNFAEFAAAFHYKGSFAIAMQSGQWAARPLTPVPMYLLKFRAAADALCANSTKILVPYPRCTIGARSRPAHSHSRRNAVL